MTTTSWNVRLKISFGDDFWAKVQWIKTTSEMTSRNNDDIDTDLIDDKKFDSTCDANLWHGKCRLHILLKFWPIDIKSDQ